MNSSVTTNCSSQQSAVSATRHHFTQGQQLLSQKLASVQTALKKLPLMLSKGRTPRLKNGSPTEASFILPIFVLQPGRITFLHHGVMQGRMAHSSYILT